MKKWFLLLVLFYLSGFVFGQTKMISMEDIAFSKIRPETLRQFQWIPGSEIFSYSDPVSNDLTISGGRETQKGNSLTLNELNQWLRSSGLPEVKSFPTIKWIDQDKFWFMHGKNLVIADIGKKSAISHIQFSDDAERIEVAADLKSAFNLGNDLYFSTSGSSRILIAKSENPDVIYGQDVHQREFGIEKGLFWSPEGKLLAFYRSDNSGVTKYPYVDFTTRPATSIPAIYPMAGMNNQVVSIGIFNPETKKTVYLKTGEPADQYLTNITWSPDSKWVWVAHVNRDQNKMKLVRYHSETGEPDGVIVEETDSSWVEPTTGPLFVPGKSGNFLWLSKRNGWRHLYLYEQSGKLVKQITSGEWDVIETEGFDDAGRIYFISTGENPTERHLYRTGLKSNGIEKLTEEKGTHQIILSSTGKYFIDYFNSLEVPNSIRLVESGKKIVKTFLNASDPLVNFQSGETKLFSFTGPDSTVLFGRIITPKEMNPDQKYPVILYVYGGPHSQQVTESWPTGPYNLWFHHMASKGFIVLTVDNRGTQNRGKVFEQKIFRKLGTLEMEDQLSGLNYLFSNYPNADRARVGVFGWSYGGFLTTSLMTRMPSSFKVGVAGAPVIDWKYYETVYTERYMDSPEQNPAGFSTANLINYVPNLKGKLLIIQGTSDPIVMWQHSLLFVKEAASTNTPLDYFVYPGHLHGIAGKDRIHLWTKITTYFLDNL
ncbi:MAG: DPP IV N-terminal domain-containing protein [Bacteroidetes bacterium]|nr:DPP IV N-terminal domain-containing protein [Bacteroidota bacterium]